MSTPGALERIVLIPRNGLGNRLQALASATILAAQWDVPLLVMWEPESAAPAAPDDLFAPETLLRFTARAWVDDLLDQRHESLPRYLNAMPDRNIIVLAGHDRGEQVFMPELDASVRQTQRPTTLVIIAGGLFHQSTPADFLQQRCMFYRNLRWNADLAESAHLQSEAHHPYSALHIRETDRSIEAPPRSLIRRSLAELAHTVGGGNLFIAADSRKGRDAWAAESERLGFVPWSVSDTDFDRTALTGARSAALDWLLLAGAHALVYPAASTFSSEAAVAIGDVQRSHALTASSSLQHMRRSERHVRNALTFPWRRIRATARS